MLGVVVESTRAQPAAGVLTYTAAESLILKCMNDSLNSHPTLFKVRLELGGQRTFYGRQEKFQGVLAILQKYGFLYRHEILPRDPKQSRFVEQLRTYDLALPQDWRPYVQQEVVEGNPPRTVAVLRYAKGVAIEVLDIQPEAAPPRVTVRYKYLWSPTRVVDFGLEMYRMTSETPFQGGYTFVQSNVPWVERWAVFVLAQHQGGVLWTTKEVAVLGFANTPMSLSCA